jgi:hypothetical protein
MKEARLIRPEATAPEFWKPRSGSVQTEPILRSFSFCHMLCFGEAVAPLDHA